MIIVLCRNGVPLCMVERFSFLVGAGLAPFDVELHNNISSQSSCVRRYLLRRGRGGDLEGLWTRCRIMRAHHLSVKPVYRIRVYNLFIGSFFFFFFFSPPRRGV